MRENSIWQCWSRRGLLVRTDRLRKVYTYILWCIVFKIFSIESSDQHQSDNTSNDVLPTGEGVLVIDEVQVCLLCILCTYYVCMSP